MPQVRLWRNPHMLWYIRSARFERRHNPNDHRHRTLQKQGDVIARLHTVVCEDRGEPICLAIFFRAASPTANGANS